MSALPEQLHRVSLATTLVSVTSHARTDTALLAPASALHTGLRNLFHRLPATKDVLSQARAMAISASATFPAAMDTAPTQPVRGVKHGETILCGRQ